MRFAHTLLFIGVLLCTGTPLPAYQGDASETGFLVLAPDRGFLGNEEMREAFEEYRPGFNAALVYITREETSRFLKEGIARLEQHGAKRIVLLPMFLSEHQGLYRMATAFFTGIEQDKLTTLPVTIAETVSQSHLLTEIFADRVQALSEKASSEMLVTVVQGAHNPADGQAMLEEIRQVRSRLPSSRFSFGGYAEVILAEGEQGNSSWMRLEQTLKEAKAKNLRPVIIPLDFTWKADRMMSLSFRLQRIAQQYQALFDGNDLTPHPCITLWLKKQSNSHLPITPENLGVIVMPHGANYNWNRTMMDAIKPLQSKYNIEYAFSMGDAEIIERAVRKLEQRGARAITVVRVFSLETSFKEATEYALGLRDDIGHGSHGGTMETRPIRSGCVLFTLGGVEASPLFAEALLDRALEVSKNPKDETIILLAHGTEQEEENRRWENNLSALTSHMSLTAKLQGKTFRNIQSATWREDWPELREKAITHIRSMVEDASQQNGTAIIIPARTTRAGKEEEWLSGLSYVYNGSGFAPHQLFVRWVEEQILLSLSHFNNNETPPGILSTQKPAARPHSVKH